MLPYQQYPTFFTKSEANEFFEFVKQIPRVRPRNPMNSSMVLHRTSVAHWNDAGSFRGRTNPPQ